MPRPRSCLSAAVCRCPLLRSWWGRRGTVPTSSKIFAELQYKGTDSGALSGYDNTQIEVASPRDASIQSLHRAPISPRSSEWPGPPLHPVPALAPLDHCRFSDSDDINNDQPRIPERHATMDTKT
ncbi:hypothetical protein DFH08DRAFT_974844 [Mycena albidolilacea]|uniref:Uncharacterized protein n=1 Tax=Mycena albidolilacea TaxID=1033008 RepID=A0AAD6Z6Q3_9AGAR|nr:hypothetical protein DFH08DRAFT_974844 [Mycena albidolilacea]